jgi:hypothetical protein
MMNQPADGWPEITYQYVMHYFWEPGHLLLMKDRAKIDEEMAKAKLFVPKPRSRDLVHERMKAEEVPLNYFLNVLLRLAPSALRRACMEPFGVDITESGLSHLVVKTPGEYKGTGLKTQPDVHLESETARVFIEVKVDAILTHGQIEKYVRLHEELDRRTDNTKRRYILFLVKSEELKISGTKQRYCHHDVQRIFPPLFDLKADGITFGSTSWANFARTLQEELDRRLEEQSDSTEMLAVLIGDFLGDLQSRGLYKRSKI